jgi:ankyrin repeat protein
MTLQSLPVEILIKIWASLEEAVADQEEEEEEEKEKEQAEEKQLEAESNLNALVQTCRFFHDLFNNALYAHAVQHNATHLSKWIGRAGQLQTLARFIAAGGDGVLRNPATTPLFTAARHGQTGVISMLMDMGIDLQMQSPKGKIALGLAAQRGHLELVRLFLDSGVPVDSRHMDNTTALMVAAAEGHDDVAELLMERGADPAAVDGWGSNADGRSVLAHAIIGGCAPHLIGLFLAHAPGDVLNELDGYMSYPLGLAAERGDIPAAKLLLAAGASLDTGGRDNTPLRMAIEAGEEEMAQFLLDAGADPNENPSQYAPLPLAASMGCHEILADLLKRGTDPFYVLPWGETPLSLASWKGHYDCVKILLDAGVPPELDKQRPHTPLVSALKHGHNDIALLLAKRGAKLNPAYDERHHTPLIWAIRNAHVKLVKLLLESEVDVHAGTRYGNAPIIVAAMHGQSELVKLLLEHGADPSAYNEHGCTALTIAAQRGWLEVILALLDYEPGTAQTNDSTEQLCLSGLRIQTHTRDIIEKQDFSGRTALFHATANGHHEIVAVLLLRGSKVVDLKSRAGRSPRSVMETWLTKPELLVDRQAVTAIQQMFNNPKAAGRFLDTKWSPGSRATNISRRKTMAELITTTLDLDLWLFLQFEVPCHRCQTPLAEYSEIFVCDICSNGARRMCAECITRRKGKNQQLCEQAKHKLTRLQPFEHPPRREKWVWLREFWSAHLASPGQNQD